MVRLDHASAGSLTHRESGMMAELAQEQALSEGKNIIIDGSLRDWKWYYVVLCCGVVCCLCYAVRCLLCLLCLLCLCCACLCCAVLCCANSHLPPFLPSFIPSSISPSSLSPRPPSGEGTQASFKDSAYNSRTIASPLSASVANETRCMLAPRLVQK